MKKIIYLLLFLLIQSKAFAQYPTLLKDINTVGTQFPHDYCKVNNIMFFSHDDGVHGRELWRTDGTAAGTYMVKDINAGYGSGIDYGVMIAFNGLLFFTAKTTVTGKELWKSDGTEAGTVLIKDISSGSLSSDPQLFTPCGSNLMFTANARTSATTGSGFELWRTDGTAAGTVEMSNVSNGSDNGQITDIEYAPVLFTDNVFFVETQNTISASNNGIWQTSQSCFFGCSAWSTPSIIAGTTGATNLLFNVNSGTSSIDVFFRNATYGLSKYNLNNSTLTQLCTFPTYYSFLSLASYNNIIYFSGYDATNGWELWKSDGTVAGTVFLKNINNNPTNDASIIRNFQICNNELFFTADDGVHGYELWKTNGTAAGTILVNDIVPGVDSSYPFNLSVDGTKIYFLTAPTDPIYAKYQVRVFDASTSQLTLLKDFTPIPYFEENLDIALLNNTIFFTGYDATHGFEVWKSDGTAAGTSILKDIDQGNSSPTGFMSVGSNTFFAAYDDYIYYAPKPFVSNGTTAGTFKLADISVLINGGSSPNSIFTNVNGTIFFGASDATNGTELWKTNGTVAGTVLVKDIVAGAGSSSPKNFCNGNGTLFFTVYNDTSGGDELWKSDGTVAGTVLIGGFGGNNLYNLTYFNGFVYFFNYTDLWRSDGTAGGTTLVKNFDGVDYSEPFMVFNNKLYVVASENNSGFELWSTNGTNTTLLKDIYVGTSGSYPKNLTTNGVFSKFYFTADNGVNGRELWVSDGTSAGTTLININPEIISFPTNIAQGSTPQSLTFVGNLLLFSAYYNEFSGANHYGRELWRSGGTAASTTLVKDINPLTYADGIANETFSPFPTVGSYVYFPAVSNNTNGVELWKSNGNATGTTLVNDLFQGDFNDGVTPYTSMHINNNAGRVFFEATNGQNGRELWNFQFCPQTQTINTTVQTNTQKQQAGTTLISTSNIANTDFSFTGLDVLYTAGNVIDLRPGFNVVSKQQNPISHPITYRQTVFKAQIGGCN